MSMQAFVPPQVLELLPPDWVAWCDAALKLGDTRVQNWFLMNPFQALAIALAYLVLIAMLVLFTKTTGIRFELKGVVLLHNFNLFALSLYMMLECIRQAFVNGYSLFGNGIDSSANGLGIAQILWIFYLSKILEFGDTIIMALRGSYRQITFLHVYHHASIFLVWWVIVYFAPGGDSYFSAALNSGIHVFMYGYYFWSAITPKNKVEDPSVKKPRPTWRQPEFYRQYITSGQMTQFCCMLVQACYDLYFGIPNFPMFTVWILFYYMFTMLGLFGNFYLQSYIKPKTAKVTPLAAASATASVATADVPASSTTAPTKRTARAD